MRLKGWFHVFMAEAGDGSGGGDGGGASSDGSGSGDPAGGSGASAASGGSGDGGQGNALQQGAQGQAVAIPEKYQVKKEDGTLDIAASSLKLAEAYGHLEKRMGGGDAPPKSADEYQIAVPDAIKDAWDPKGDPLMSDFLKDAHAAGLTQKQMDLVMGKYFDLAPRLLEGSAKASAEECVAQLKTEWKTEAQYKAEIGNAYKAAVGYAGGDADYIVNTYGNDPKVIKMLARMGAEMGEDKSLNPGGTMQGGESVEKLMTSEAYNNPRHADHARVSRQVQDHFNRQAAAAERSGNAPLI